MDDKELMFLQSDVLYEAKEKLEKKLYSLKQKGVILDGSCGSSLGEQYVWLFAKTKKTKVDIKIRGEALTDKKAISQKIDEFVKHFLDKNPDLLTTPF